MQEISEDRRMKPNRPHSKRSSVWRRSFTTVSLVSGALVVGVLALLILGAFLPGIPVVGLFGSIVSGVVGWMALILLVALGVAVWLLVRRRNAWRIAVTGVIALAVIGSVTMTIRLVTVGTQYGVSVNPLAGSPTATRPDETAQYSEYDGQPLTVAIWRPKGQVASGDAPVALFAHGGGWSEGANIDDNSGLKQDLADRGWMVVSVEYTLSSPTHPTWDLAEAQIGCAMIWASENAGSYGADASRLVVLGDSAGGNLAINASSRANAGTLTPLCDGDIPRVSAVATVYPGVDPYGLYERTIPLGGEPGRNPITRYIGGTPDEFPERYKAVASSTYISSMMPPTLVIQGTNDHLVDPGRVYDFVDQARDAGADIELVRIPYADHVFDASPIGAQLYKGITLNWLEDHGF